MEGCIAVGSDADIVVWDPNTARTISSKTHVQAVDFNIFEGMVCHGVPEYVIVNGRVCVDEHDLKAVQGYGKFVQTPVFPPFVYDQVLIREEAKKGQQITHVASIKTEEPVAEKIVQNGNEVESKPPAQEPVSTPAEPETTLCCPSSKGQRNLQDSTFSISEELDDTARKSCIRVKNPPGGQSSGGFW